MSVPSRSIAFMEECSNTLSGKSSLCAYLCSCGLVVHENQLLGRNGVLNQCVERRDTSGSPSNSELFFDSRYSFITFLIHVLQGTITIIGHGFQEPLLSTFNIQVLSHTCICRMEDTTDLRTRPGPCKLLLDRAYIGNMYHCKALPNRIMNFDQCRLAYWWFLIPHCREQAGHHLDGHLWILSKFTVIKGCATSQVLGKY